MWWAGFVGMFVEALQRVGGHPPHFPAVQEDLRRAQVHGFRQVIFFRLLPDSTQVIAVLHSPEIRRSGRAGDPRRWSARGGWPRRYRMPPPTLPPEEPSF